METTMQSSQQSSTRNLRDKITTIEAIELAVIGFVIWSFFTLLSIGVPDQSFFDLIVFLIITEGALLGSWGIYNLYIRIARAGGRIVDIGLWVGAALLTGSYTFWAWTVLDVNRWLMSKLFYRGEAPIEYAWSVRSKQIRKLWEKMRKASRA